jgi:flagellin
MSLSIVSNVPRLTAPRTPSSGPSSQAAATTSEGPSDGDGPAAVYTPSASSVASAPTYSTRSLSLVNNVASLTAQDNLDRTNAALSSSLERLSSGLTIDRGADGPASLVISEQQRAQIAGLQNALDNTNYAVSLLQTGEGALNDISSLLARVRGLALDSASAASNDQDALDENAGEIQNVLSQIDSIASTTQFGGKKLLDGSFDGTFQIGANAGQTASLAIGAATTSALGLTRPSGGTNADGTPRVTSLADDVRNLSSGVSGGQSSSANDILKSIDVAINRVASMRGSLGAFQANTLESNANNLRVSLENTAAATSVVRDTDFASEIANFTLSQTLLQAGQTVLGNANQISSLVSSLLRG